MSHLQNSSDQNHYPHRMVNPPPNHHRAPTPWFRRTWVLIVGTAIVALGIGSAASGGQKSEAAGRETTFTATATATTTAPARPAGTVTVRPTVVRIVATKVRTRTETYTPPPKPSFGEGTYEVGADIKPGKYRTDGGTECYYARLSDLDEGLESIIGNDNFAGPNIVTVRRGEYFQAKGDCEWRHV